MSSIQLFLMVVAVVACVFGLTIYGTYSLNRDVDKSGR